MSGMTHEALRLAQRIRCAVYMSTDYAEQRGAITRAWATRHRTQRNAHPRASRQRHAATNREKDRTYYAANRERKCEISRASYARMLKAVIHRRQVAWKNKL